MKISQIDKHIVGFDGFAPRMEAPNCTDSLAPMPVQDVENFLFVGRSVELSRGELNVLSEVVSHILILARDG
jgi:hypothetical protein